MSAVAAAARGQSPLDHHLQPDRPILITGGAGFVGINLAARLLQLGRKVVILDNLSRAGVRRNLDWLLSDNSSAVKIIVGDVRDVGALALAVRECAGVFHLAAQVAVTSSLVAPMTDFEINVGGTLKLLEAVRAIPVPPPLVFTSTNKVYGALDNIALIEQACRYQPRDDVKALGVNEQQSLDFRSAYGCSKGAADQYVIDYSRSFGLHTIVFRMSCIYGPHQYGTEDQGWVAHVLASVLGGKPITIYGDGKQVRDLLFIDDLVEGLLLAMAHAARLSGEIFNIGGGALNSVSLLELIDLAAELTGLRPEIHFGEWRLCDQKYYVTDTTKFQSATAWQPRFSVRQGVDRLHAWLKQRDAQARVDALEHQHASQ